MTRYYLNDKEIETPPVFTSFDQMLQAVEGRYLAPDSVIREIHLDGETLTPDTGADGGWASIRMEDWEKVEFFTGTLSGIALESIAGAQGYLDKLAEAVPALAVKFQDAPAPEDFASLSSLCEGFLFLNMLLGKLATGYGIDFDRVTVRGASVKENLMKFVGVTKQLIDAQEHRDYILIADTLEYEILPFIPMWKEIFTAIRGLVGPAQ
ncbi:MAG: hypothetical protein LBT74_08115 [Acidobacteriota bacterium]|jgi:hypothetical protein|nr:hypothetical protein [Acidobacteriota bacterium]